MPFLLYHPRTAPTGVRLAQYLGIPSGSTPPEERLDSLVRWGSQSALRRRVSGVLINSRSALAVASNKVECFRALSEVGLATPRYATSRREALKHLKFPMLVRSPSGWQGRNTHLALQPADLDRLPSMRDTFFVEYVPKQAEYRVHVFQGRAFRSTRKVFTGTDDQYDGVVWNHETGWVFSSDEEISPMIPSIGAAAVSALGLDMGAVDILISLTGDPVILEINTGPGLAPLTLDLYGNRLARALGLTEVPGMDAVSFSEGETEDD